jgi:2-polyprenyl-3-methyl-5-hydroxy-6-metoxy-1,4-benzoquinol methylase
MTEREKQYVYNDKPRKEILPLIQGKAGTALDVGCGFGSTLAWLKAGGYCATAYGIEINEQAAAVARGRLDAVYAGNIDTMELPLAPGSVDLILCLDVLEHLNDPWGTLKKLHCLLAPNGILIASIPNVQHFSVVVPLLFKGEWRYADSGLLDRSHIRFFTGRTSRELIEGAGFSIERMTDSGLPAWMRLINLVTFKLFNPLMTVQYFIRALKK